MMKHADEFKIDENTPQDNLLMTVIKLLNTEREVAKKLWLCLHEAAMPDGNKQMVIRSRSL